VDKLILLPPGPRWTNSRRRRTLDEPVYYLHVYVAAWRRADGWTVLDSATPAVPTDRTVGPDRAWQGDGPHLLRYGVLHRAKNRYLPRVNSTYQREQVITAAVAAGLHFTGHGCGAVDTRHTATYPTTVIGLPSFPDYGQTVGGAYDAYVHAPKDTVDIP